MTGQARGGAGRKVEGGKGRRGAWRTMGPSLAYGGHRSAATGHERRPCALPQRRSSGVQTALFHDAEPDGPGGPLRGIVTSAHSSSPAGRREGSGTCSGMKKATASARRGDRAPPSGRSCTRGDRTDRPGRRRPCRPPRAAGRRRAVSAGPVGTMRAESPGQPDVATPERRGGIEGRRARPAPRQPLPVRQQLEAEAPTSAGCAAGRAVPPVGASRPGLRRLRDQASTSPFQCPAAAQKQQPQTYQARRAPEAVHDAGEVEDDDRQREPRHAQVDPLTATSATPQVTSPRLKTPAQR